MKKSIAILAAGVMSLSTAAFAQDAMSLAMQGNYCNGFDPTRAEFLEDGRLKVWCPAGSLSGNLGGGLSPEAWAGLAAAGVVLVVAAGDDDSVSSTPSS